MTPSTTVLPDEPDNFKLTVHDNHEPHSVSSSSLLSSSCQVSSSVAKAASDPINLTKTEEHDELSSSLLADSQNGLYPATCNFSSFPFSSSSFPFKTLSNVSSIPLLCSQLDFFAWDDAVCLLLRCFGIYDHILSPSSHLDLQLDSSEVFPVIKPGLSKPPSPSELAALTLWTNNDNFAQYIITSRLGVIPHQFLPSVHDHN